MRSYLYMYTYTHTYVQIYMYICIHIYNACVYKYGILRCMYYIFYIYRFIALDCALVCFMAIGRYWRVSEWQSLRFK